MPTICPSCGTRNLEGVDHCTHCGGDLRTVDLPAPASRIEQSVMQLPLTSLPLTVVHAIEPDAPLDVAVQTLVRQKIDILEVVHDNKLVGLLSVSDVVTRVGADYAAKLQDPVRDFMTPRPETLPPDAPISFALNKMDVGGYRHVPVVQGDRMIGVASARNVISFLLEHGHDPMPTGQAPAGAWD